MDPIKDYKKFIEQNAQNAELKIRHKESLDSSLKLQQTVVQSFSALVDYLDNRVSKTAVVNQLQEIGTPDALKVVEAVNSLHDTLKTHENTDLTELTGVMRQILAEAKSIPKDKIDIQIPEQKFVDYTKQFKSMTDAVQAVEKVVKEQKLIAEAPIVNVPETNVEVDLKPLQTSIKDVVKAVNGIVIPEVTLDTKPVETLLKKSNKLLEEILDKPVGGGGGGGLSWVTVNQDGTPVPIELTADGKIPVEAGATSTYESYVDTTTDTNLVYLGKATPGTATSSASWQIKRYNKSAGHMSFADDVTTFTKTWDNRTSYSY